MPGVMFVESTHINLPIPKALLEALDRHRATLVPRPTRTFLIRQCIAEYLTSRGVQIQASDDNEHIA